MDVAIPSAAALFNGGPSSKGDIFRSMQTFSGFSRGADHAERRSRWTESPQGDCEF